MELKEKKKEKVIGNVHAKEQFTDDTTQVTENRIQKGMSAQAMDISKQLIQINKELDLLKEHAHCGNCELPRQIGDEWRDGWCSKCHKEAEEKRNKPLFVQ